MSKATKKALSELHGKLAEVMGTFLKEGVKVMDDKSGEIVSLTPPAAYLNVVRQFLKDNSIDSPAALEEIEAAASRPIFQGLPFTQTDEFGPTQ